MAKGALNLFFTINLVATQVVTVASIAPLCLPSAPKSLKPRIPLSTTNTTLSKFLPRIDTIGDEHRDITSSTAFFSSIDVDGDGNLTGSELSDFLRDDIGGDYYDTNEEIKVEVEGLLTRVDLDADSGLDQQDVMRYLDNNLGLLLVEDVAEWLIHSVQLPVEEVQGKFCVHHVTGSDFPELVENDGERLKTELGITNPMYARKIMRHVKARMVGLQSTLPRVEPHTPKLVHNRMSLTWEKLKLESGFPVHKYRIQRKEVPRQGVNGVLLRMLRGGRNPTRDKWETWETVYVDKDNVYVDINREAGFDYDYRIEAWNFVGNSPWVTFSTEWEDGNTYDNARASYFWFCLFLVSLICGIASTVFAVMPSNQRKNLTRDTIFPDGKNLEDICKCVVLVGLWDTKEERILGFGSGFIADNSRDLILTAGHIFYDLTGEKITQNYEGRNTKAIIGTLCKTEDADDRYMAQFTHFAKIIAHDIKNLDAAVLHITTRFEKPFKSLSVRQPDEPMRGSLKDEKMMMMKLRPEAHLDESIKVIGFNQSGEGRHLSGTYLNHTVSIASGYVCGTGHAGQPLVDTRENTLVRATKSEIIVEDCPAYVGYSGGPCVNQDGMVIGILCREHPKIDKRCYLAPAAKLKEILVKAQKSVDDALELVSNE